MSGSREHASLVISSPSRIPIAFLLGFLAGPTLAHGQPATWSLVRNALRVMYPDVPRISTDSLATLMTHTKRVPLLLDVRTEDEFAISHLRGAKRLDPVTKDFAVLEDIPRDALIITYCSVGLRSAAMARRLARAGFTRVANLEGSMFAWANEGYPIYRDSITVQTVHPYDRRWGRLLKEELRAPLRDE